MSVENEVEDKEVMDQYNAAFDDASGGAEQGEPAAAEEAIASEEGQSQAVEAQAEPVAEVTEAGPVDANVEAEAAKTTTDPVQETAAETPAPTEAEAADAALEIQRLKSWEGRLKKQAAEQKAREEAIEAEAATRLAKANTELAALGNPALEQAVGSVADQVADGTLSVKQAMEQVSADFGDDFIRMIKVIVSAQAAEESGKAVAEVKGKVEGLANNLALDAERSHFERIEQAHPDFQAIRQDPAFAQFIDAADPDLQRIAQGGTAKEVIQLVKAYKTQAAQAAKPVKAAEPEGVDAAAGVRSGSLQLPTPTGGNDDYDSAFAEAAAMGTK